MGDETKLPPVPVGVQRLLRLASASGGRKKNPEKTRRKRDDSKETRLAQKRVDSLVLEAWILAVVGVFFLGIVFEPFALLKAREAARLVHGNPELSGGGLAQAALYFSGAFFAIWAFLVVSLVVHYLLV